MQRNHYTHIILLVFTFLITSSASLVAQKKYGPTNDSLYLGFHRDSILLLKKPTYMIVPFHPDKYMSEIDVYIAQQNPAYTFQHTRGFFRKGLDNAIIIAAKQFNNYVSMHEDRPQVNKDLDFFYKMTYTPVVPYTAPVIQKSAGFKTKLAQYWEKLHREVTKNEEPGTRIKEGQIVSVEDSREYITKGKIINQIIVDSTFKKYKTDYIIYITFLEILNAANNQIEFEQEKYNRIIKAHYTVFDKDGNELFSLIKKHWFNSNENDLPTILKTHFVPLGEEIVYSLDSYRFLEAGLSPLTETEVELSKNKAEFRLPTLQKLK